MNSLDNPKDFPAYIDLCSLLSSNNLNDTDNI